MRTSGCSTAATCASCASSRSDIIATQIVVISDTHIRHADRLPPPILEAVRGADLVVHCGDYTGAELLDELRSLARQFVGVLGNSDLSPLRERLPRREVLALHGHAIGVCHPLWGGLPDGIADDILQREFSDLRLDALLFGHTHEGLVERRPHPDPLPLGEGQGPSSVILSPDGIGTKNPSPSPLMREGTILLVNPGPGYADFMQPASFARLRVVPEGLEAELVVL